MKTRYCPYCKKAVRFDQTVCHRCHNDLGPANAFETTTGGIALILEAIIGIILLVTIFKACIL